jgi:hypothetical protein
MSTWLLLSAITRLAGAVVVGVLIGVVVGLLTDAPLGVLAGIAGMATVFADAGWIVLRLSIPLAVTCGGKTSGRSVKRSSLRPHSAGWSASWFSSCGGATPGAAAVTAFAGVFWPSGAVSDVCHPLGVPLLHADRGRDRLQLRRTADIAWFPLRYESGDPMLTLREAQPCPDVGDGAPSAATATMCCRGRPMRAVTTTSPRSSSAHRRLWSICRPDAVGRAAGAASFWGSWLPSERAESSWSGSTWAVPLPSHNASRSAPCRR